MIVVSLLVTALVVAANGYMLYRNYVVCQYRLRVLDASSFDGERFQPFDRLPSYQAMFWDLWRFDWSDYLDAEE